MSTAHALRGFQESAISLLLLFDVTRYTFKVAPQTDTFLEAAIITALFRGALRELRSAFAYQGLLQLFNIGNHDLYFGGLD